MKMSSFLLRVCAVLFAQFVTSSASAAVDPTLGLRIRQSPSENENLHELALSGRFPVLESVVRSGSGDQIIRWTRVQDRARCAEAADRGAPFGELILRPSFAEQQLVKGVCALGERQQRSIARYELDFYTRPQVLRDLTTGTVVARVNPQTRSPVWSMFGLPRFNATSWTDDGMMRRPDQATDEELATALRSTSPSLRLAALSVLGERVETSTLWEQPLRVREIQPTRASVADALIASGELVSPDRERRQEALRTVASLGEAAQRLLPAVLQSLRAPLVPEEDLSTRLARERVDRVLPGSGLFEAPRSKTGAQDEWVANAAALAAVRMGSIAAANVAQSMDAELRQHLRRAYSTYSIGGLLLLAGVAPGGDDVALELLSSDGPPLVIANGCRIVALRRQVSPTLRSVAYRTCAGVSLN